MSVLVHPRHVDTMNIEGLLSDRQSLIRCHHVVVFPDFGRAVV